MIQSTPVMAGSLRGRRRPASNAAGGGQHHGPRTESTIFSCNVVGRRIAQLATRSPLISGMPDARRRRLTHRAMPVGAIAGVAFVVGVVFGALHVPPERRGGGQVARAGGRGGYPPPVGPVSGEGKQRTQLPPLAQTYRDAALTPPTPRPPGGPP